MLGEKKIPPYARVPSPRPSFREVVGTFDCGRNISWWSEHRMHLKFYWKQI